MPRTRTASPEQEPRLPTSRSASAPERGVLAVLRGLAPRRRLSDQESRIIAELQANRLLELAGRPQPAMPIELITELPRISVRYDADLPASGMAQWSSGRWLIALNASEPATRLRFSLGHEFKHVIDHRHVELLYGSDLQAEAAADHFAACLWMPKRELTSAYAAGMQSVADLALLFGVSAQAMARRLTYLGLRTPEPRSPLRPVATPARQKRHYLRPVTALLIGGRS